MEFNDHYKIRGAHAFLSASNYHWINYDEEKLVGRYLTHKAAARGSRLHALADELITLRINLPRTRQTLNSYVNDAIGFRMTTEVVLFYSENAFGTADAVSFRNGKLRIHDLKSGVTKASMNQLRVYMAFFCLEYGIKPKDIQAELRIYQNDEIMVEEPEHQDIIYIMDRIVTFDKILKEIQEEDLR